MVRTALICCAGLIAVTCVAGAQTPPRPQQSDGGGPKAQTICHDAATFAGAVKILQLPFLKNAKQTPDGLAVPNGIKPRLSAAFDLAPKFFQDQLCSLTGIFLTAAGDSWGFRHFTDGRFIAISDALLRANAPPYSKYESVVLKRLLKDWDVPHHITDPSDPDDNSTRTILAALAHEYGHVLWYDSFVPDKGQNFREANFCKDPADPTKSKFYKGSWSQIKDEPPVGRWRHWDDFTSENFSSTHMADDVKTEDILDAVPPDPFDLKEAGKKLQRVYGRGGDGALPGRWASLLATFTAEEDFVETFKLFVLQRAKKPLSSLPVSIPNASSPTEDIPKTCSSRPVLQEKLRCFTAAFCSGADPCGSTCP